MPDATHQAAVCAWSGAARAQAAAQQVAEEGGGEVERHLLEVEREREANSEGNEEHVPLPAGWISDRVIKVIRKSPSAGVSVAYRLIVEGS